MDDIEKVEQEKQETQYEEAEEPNQEKRVYVPNPHEERKLVRKVDLRLFPVLWVMYVINYIDRSNIGNAKVGGMQADLHLSSGDYSLALLIFFVGYLLLEIPSNMILSRTRPSIYLPALMFTWGCITIGFKGVNSLSGLVAIRFFLGIAESGFFPGVWLLLSSWYRREELSKRFAFFYSAAIISGAFGGLLAGVITQYMDMVGGVRGWKWLFILEGLATVVVAVTAIFLLPDFPSNTKWLSPIQKEIAVERLKVQDIADAKIGRSTHWEGVKLALKDWRTWTFTICYMCIAGAGTISYFIPTLTTSMGYAGRKAQFMSAPPYAVAFVCSLLTSLHSDRVRERAFHIAVPISLAAVAFIILAVTTNNTAKYVLLCVGAAGIWTALPVMLAFASDCIPRPPEKRGVSIAIINSLGNFSSVYGSYLWPSSDGPQYKMGFGVTCAFCFIAAIMALFIRYCHGPILTAEQLQKKRVVPMNFETEDVDQNTEAPHGNNKRGWRFF